MRGPAFSFRAVLLLVSAATPQLSAAPIITSVVNAAGNIAFHAPLTQGSIFILKGSGLGLANNFTAGTTLLGIPIYSV